MTQPGRAFGERFAGILPALCAVIVPVTLQFCWYSFNRSYPRSDEGSYIGVAQNIWIATKTSGFWTGLSHFYLDRMWKPLAHPTLAAPAMIAFGGSILKTVATMMTLYYAVLAIYVYGLFSLAVMPWSAAIGTMAVSSVPWLIVRAHSFNSDLPGVVCAIAGLYHLAKAARTPSRLAHACAFSAWMGLAFCIRPAETILLFLVPCSVVGFRAKKSGLLRLRDVAAMVAVFLPFLAILAWTSRDLSKNQDLAATQKYLLPWLALVWTPVIGAVLFRKKLGLSAWGLAIVVPFCLIATGWYLPYTESLFGWTYVSSFGEDARRLDRLGMNYVTFIGQILSRVGGYSILFLLAVAAGGSSIRGVVKRWGLFLTAFITASLLILLGASSYNPDTRYYIGPGILLMVLAGALALQRDGRFYRLRVFLVALGASFLASIGLASIYSPGKIPRGITTVFPDIVEQIPVRSVSEDPGVQFVHDLESILPTDRPLTIDSVWFKGDGDITAMIDPDMLTIISRQEGHRWKFDLLYAFKMKSVDEQLVANNQRYDYALVGPLGGEIQKDGNMPITYLAKKIEDAYISGNLGKLGLKQAGMIRARCRDGRTGKFLVVQSLSRIPS